MFVYQNSGTRFATSQVSIVTYTVITGAIRKEVFIYRQQIAL